MNSEISNERQCSEITLQMKITNRTLECDITKSDHENDSKANTQEMLCNNLDTTNEDESLINMEEMVVVDELEDSEDEQNFLDSDYRAQTSGTAGTSKSKTVQETGIHKCQFCEKSFRKQKTLFNHLVESHLDQDITSLVPSSVFTRIRTCGTCNYKTIVPAQFKRHMISVHKEEPKPKEFTCEKCGYKTMRKSNYKKHVKNHNKYDNPSINSQGQIKCKKCGYVCQTPDIYKTHMLQHREIYNCNDCRYRTSFMSNLTLHKQQHRKTAKLECEFCKRRFYQKHDLDRHLFKKYPWDKIGHMITTPMFSCSICHDYRTFDEMFLSQHMSNLHGDDFTVLGRQSEFMCNVCGFETTSKTQLKRHMKEHTKELQHPCPACKKIFKYKHSLDDHILLQHSNNESARSKVTAQTYKCSHCNFQSVKQRAMRKHVNRAHDTSQLQPTLEQACRAEICGNAASAD